MVAGGPERQESVARGLAAVPPTAPWILVHDGVRPCITPELVRRVVEATRLHGAAIAALPVAETLKRGVEGWVKETVPRDGLWAIQTPQVFRREALERGLAAPEEMVAAATDDARLVELTGGTVRVVEAPRQNIKVTTAADVERASAALAAA